MNSYQAKSLRQRNSCYVVTINNVLLVKGDYMEKDSNQHQIFDNAFLSECAWHKRLLIPLINEVFNKQIPEDAIIEHSANEQFSQKNTDAEKETLIKRITDALIRVGNEKYHFECESKNDGEILIRIGEYDMQIAVNDALYENYNVKMNLPETAVVFLRNHRKVPNEGIISYQKGNQVLRHKIPFLKVSKYSLEELENKHLYMLLPFYLIRYEHAIIHTPKKYELIENEAYKVYDIIIKAYENGNLTKTECENILVICKDVVSIISRNTEIHERLVNTMGNEILLTAEERGIVKGIEQGAYNTTIEFIKKAMKSFSLSFDDACDKLMINDKEKYRGHING